MTDADADKGVTGIFDIRRPSTARSLILCGAGALVGLVIAGLGLFTAQGTRTFVVPAEDAATVNNAPILMSDFIGQIRTLYDVPLEKASMAEKHKVLDDMIREELYVQRGVELGLPADDIDVRQALVAGTESVVSQDALTSRPSESELRAWYDAHRDIYSSEGVMTVQEFLLPPSAVGGASKIVQALRNGSPPNSLDLKSSKRMDDGAEFYFAAKIHLGDALFAIARSMNDGEISDPVVQSDGAHILVMNHNQTPILSRYEAVRDRTLHDFLDAKVKRLQVGNSLFLRRRADIKIAGQLR